MKKTLICFSIVLLAILLMTGCSGSLQSGNEDPKSSVDRSALHLMVTRDFGEQIIFGQRVEYEENASLLDILQAHAQVETAYGGSFINGINGLKSSSKSSGNRQDWFFYVNGIACDVGVLDYDPQNAGSVWWDYHPWQMGPANSAVIGSSPEPFLHGYRGTVKPTLIMSSPADVKASKLMKETLETLGVSQIAISNLVEEKVKNREGPTIVLGEWNDLKKLRYLNDFNKAYNRNGSGIHFIDQGLELLDYNGDVVKKLNGSTGVIIASGEGLGDDSPMWLISGTDEDAWQNALNLLIKYPEKIEHLYGAAVIGEEIIPLPFH
ncbi:MAG: DUF4430 domain-containing protein [Syntrophomonadaceae bacterium]|nr:DUF4430 domain-containing protein [Syntrophomonadaceae bacterium]MDD3022321.1 DUF4430 domain-containing protein [Syntrophomonadaceae bacterium]